MTDFSQLVGVVLPLLPRILTLTCLSMAEKRSFSTFSFDISSVRLYKMIYLTKMKNEK